MSEVREMTVKEMLGLAGLKEAGIIPPEASLVDAKLIDDTYFMVKLG